LARQEESKSLRTSIINIFSVKALKNKDTTQAQCPHIDGTRVSDLLTFLKQHKKDEFLPGVNRAGKPLKYDRDWLLVVIIKYLPLS
jgi:hypothetical protein